MNSCKQVFLHCLFTQEPSIYLIIIIFFKHPEINAVLRKTKLNISGLHSCLGPGRLGRTQNTNMHSVVAYGRHWESALLPLITQ